MSKEVATIAKRLDWLFTHHRKPDGSRYTYREIEALTADQGHPVDAGTIGRLRNGQITFPGLLKVDALATAFGLRDPRLLYREEFSEDELERAVRDTVFNDPVVRQIATLSATLNDEQRAAVLQLVRSIAPQPAD